MDKTIQFSDMLTILKRRWLFIVLLTFLAASISGILSYVILKPVYQASTQILVNQKNPSTQIDTSFQQSNVDLINTYRDIIKSPIILEKVIHNLNLDMSIENLNKNITVTSQQNSQVFTLSVQNNNPAKAVEIANNISDTFHDDIPSIMKVDNVNILAKAELKQNPIPIKPNKILNITIGLLVGFMFGSGIALLLEILDSTLKSEDDIMDVLGVSVIGTIPRIEKISTRRKRKFARKNAGVETIATEAKESG
ncbi:Wzz/FepE/Etk N-terminal domain-containing protein [Bacillus sp. FJAT-49736]|uniref:YveK family protein n=1 Tax=Bacillus sp. FJAT-49736 TaxID=2833582 RepID=UPI001BC9AF92|nr:Wzz/FepE/Etk N-terminal domain-containing protein [Bacillus sp. FJAT-49736]MBS4172937.1 capsular biosynthesis protein [Bacillus sp. FJAT-49736]